MNIQIKSILILFCLFISATSVAQSLKFVSFSKNLDPMYVGLQKKDLNGDICALVKVQLPVPGVKFEGNVIASEFDISEYLVYMSAGSKRMVIKCPHVNSLNIDFSTLSDITSLESKSIYTLVLDVTQDNSTLNVNDQLKIDYDQLVLKADESFKKRDFSSYRALYDEAASLKYRGLFSMSDFDKIVDVDTIVAAQNRFEAITPQLARAFSGINSFTIPAGFSEGVMVVDDKRGNVALISTNGDKITMNNTFIHCRELYKDGKLPISQNGEHRFINKNGISVLDYRASFFNKLFKNEDYNLSSFEDGYSIVFNSNSGKIGLINIGGQTVLSPQKKYNHIYSTTRGVYLSDDKSFYKWPTDYYGNLRDKKRIYKIFDYKGYISDVTDDYVITSDWKNKKYWIYPFSGDYIYWSDADSMFEGTSDSVIFWYNKNSYIYNFAKDTKIKLPWGCRRVDEDLIFDGINCYDFSGNLIFSLDQKHEFHYRGYTDGFMLVSCNGIYRYIDKKGNTLENSSFTLPDRTEKMMHCSKPFGDGFGIIFRNGTWGLVDRYGQTTFDYLK